MKMLVKQYPGSIIFYLTMCFAAGLAEGPNRHDVERGQSRHTGHVWQGIL